MSNLKEFPINGLMPKQETESSSFVRKYPECDGKGVLVAILDTGVDPGAAGLSTTTDGKPKIVDIIDCTGGGDVDTSRSVEAVDGVILGLTNRKLFIPNDWKNPSGNYKIGLKRAFDLFPRPLQSRIQNERKKTWDFQNSQLISTLKNQLSEMTGSGAEITKMRQEIEEKINQLQEMQKNYTDPGPIYDVICFHDGENWQVCVDVDESGILKNAPLLTEYRIQHKYASFGKETLLNFCVNVYDNGNVVSLVADCGSHGTHVAGIVAGHYPEQPELNGIAPGAQIISLKVGEIRIDTMETLNSLTRALIEVGKHKCDLANLSYGEPTTLPNDGRFVQICNQLVYEVGTIFVSSAGNSGPSISTVGGPGGTTSSIIGVGAYASSALMESAHSLLEKLPSRPYPWSSKGPTYDGDLGVSVSAPGGAIAPVPNWTLQKNQLMEGTSMASPNCCGGLALVLSALKRENIPYSVSSIRRSLENTALKTVEYDPFDMGCGLVQVDKTLSHSKKYHDVPYRDVRFQVSVRHGTSTTRGIYLREPEESNDLIQRIVSVEPIFLKDDMSGALNPSKVALEIRVGLVATVPWIICPEHLVMMHGGRQFSIRVDPRSLPEGGIHYGEVHGFDLANPEYGPLFRVPVTVVKPIAIPLSGPRASSIFFQNEKFQPGQIKRMFLAVPDKATWMDFTIIGHHSSRPRTYSIQFLQKTIGESHRNADSSTIILGQDKFEKSFSVVGGMTIEVCVAQSWQSLGQGEVSIEIQFHGILPSVNQIYLTDQIVKIDLKTYLRPEEIVPSASFDTLRKSIRPSESKIKPLGERDRIFDGKQIYQQLLTYKFSMSENGEVTPRLPIMESLLYENPYESQFWMIFDSNQRMIGCGDAFTHSVKLLKTSYTLMIQIRHDSIDLLEKVSDMVIHLDIKKDPINLNCYPDLMNSRTEKNKFTSKKTSKGDCCTIYISSPREKIPKDAANGDILVGSIKFEKKTKGYPIFYNIVLPEKKSSSEKSQPAELKSQDYEEEMRDAKLKWLKKAKESKNDDLIKEIIQDLESKWSDNIIFLSFKLSLVESNDHEEIIKSCELILSKIDTKEIAQFYGVRQSDSTDLSLKKRMDATKKILIETLIKKIDSQIQLFKLGGQEDILNGLQKRVEVDFQELEKWMDLEDSTVLIHSASRKQINRQFAQALKLLHKCISENEALPDKKMYELKKDLIRSLGWDHWAEYEEKWNLIRFPVGLPHF